MQRNKNRMTFGLASESVYHYKYILGFSFQHLPAGRSRSCQSIGKVFRAYIVLSSEIDHLNL